MKKRAILYVRVSTDEQAEKGYSLRHQEEILNRYCEFKGIKVIRCFREDHSAKDFNRPQFQQLLEFIKSNKGDIDVLIFTKWDRFSRNATESYSMIRIIEKLGIELYCFEQPLDMQVPESKIMLSIFLATPEVENDRRALNTTAGMRRAKKEGRWVASAPKGYSYDRSGKKSLLVPNKDSKFIIRAFEEVLKGALPINEIRKMLNQQGFQCSQSQFYNIIRNPVYMGKIHIKRWKDEPEQIVDGLHKPIISERLFHEVQEILDGKRKPIIKRSKNELHLALRGHLICPKCAKVLTGSASSNRFKTKYYYYHCQPGCKARFKAIKANLHFSEVLKSFDFPEEVYTLYRKSMQQLFKDSIRHKKEKIKEVDRELKNLSEAIITVEDKWVKGIVDDKTFNSIKERYQSRIDDLLSKRLDLRTEDSDWMQYIKFNFNLIKDLPMYYQEADVDTKHRIIGSIFPEKLVYDGKTYRTSRMNTFVELFANNNKVFQMEENKKAVKTDDFSTLVAPPGIEPGFKV